MAIDFIIRGVNKPVGDGTLTEDESMTVSNRKGAVTGYAFAGAEVPSRHLSGKQVPPDFIVVRSDVTEAQALPYLQPWQNEPSFSRQSLDVSTDQWRGTVSATNVRTSDGHGGITQAQAETFLSNWNVSNMAFTPNSAAGDFTIFGLATSRRFWGRDLTGLVFTERSYNETTGEHEIRLDYGDVFANQDAAVANFVGELAEIRRQNNAQNTIDYCVWRGDPAHDPTPRGPLIGDGMFAAIRDDVAEALEIRLATRRYKFTDSSVDQVIAAGGYMEVTPAQLLANIEDRLDG